MRGGYSPDRPASPDLDRRDGSAIDRLFADLAVADRPVADRGERDGALPAGSLDPSFGSAGLATASPMAHSVPTAVAIQPDGKILVGGRASSDGTEPQWDFALARFTSAGALDLSFNATGMTTTAFGTSAEKLWDLKILPDGRILGAGYGVSSWFEFAAAMYLPSGALDPSFDENGKVFFRPEPSQNHRAFGVALDAAGGFVFAGYSTSDPAPASSMSMMRLDASGLVDAKFGGGEGSVTRPLGGSTDSHFFDVALQPGTGAARILAVGDATTGSDADVAVLRFDAGGVLDTAFRTGGTQLIPLGAGTTDSAFAVTVLGSGAILVAANLVEPGSGRSQLALLRLTADGVLDPAFGAGGKAIGTSGDSNDGRCLAVQSDGKLVVVGTLTVLASAPKLCAVWRFRADGSVDPGFGQGGRRSFPLGVGESSCQGCAIQADGKIVVAGSGQPTIGGASVTYLLRLLP